MATAVFDRFYADGAMDVPASLAASLQPALFGTLRDFLQHTNVWTVDVDVPLISATYDYEITPPEGTAIKRLMNFYNSTDLNKRWTWPATLKMPNIISLSRDVDQDYTFVATIAIYAIDPVDADGNPIFPEWILENYFDALYSGMLWRMYAQPGKPWSNAQLAATRYRLYVKGRGEALAETQRGNTFNNQGWTFPAAGITFGNQRGA